MAGNLLAAYGSNNQSITCTLNNLANGSQRQATAVVNTSNLFADAFVAPIISLVSTPAAAGYIQLYVLGTANGGTNYGWGATGSDAAFTIPNGASLRPLGRIGTGTTASVVYTDVFSVAAAFGGSVPAQWVVIVDNETSVAFAASACSLIYQGVYGSYT